MTVFWIVAAAVFVVILSAVAAAAVSTFKAVARAQKAAQALSDNLAREKTLVSDTARSVGRVTLVARGARLVAGRLP